MMRRFRAPRILPFTTFALAALLVMKSVDLVRAAVPATVPVKAVEKDPGQATQLAAAAPIAAAGDASVPSPSGKTVAPLSPGEQSVLTDLRHRRQQLDMRAQALDARAALLSAEEHQVERHIAQMKTLQKKLEAMNEQRQKRDDESWKSLVLLYQAMEPRDAAKIFNELDMKVLLEVVARMKESKAAPILAAMQPDKARSLTDALAHMRTQQEKPPAQTSG